MREPDGFTAFVDAHSRALLRAGWLLTSDWIGAEDLVQTALAKAWPRWDRATYANYQGLGTVPTHALVELHPPRACGLR